VDLKESVSFDVKITGDRTGEVFYGTFTALRRLTHRQELLRDKVCRELLGSNSEGATERAKSQAEMLGELSVSIIKSPTWWSENGNGLDLADDSVLREVWDQVMKIKIDAVKEVQKKAELAGQKLKDIAESNPK